MKTLFLGNWRLYAIVECLVQIAVGCYYLLRYHINFLQTYHDYSLAFPNAHITQASRYVRLVQIIQCLYSLHVLPAQCIIDVGCGTGFSSVVFSKHCKKVIGLEICPHVSDKAAKNILRLQLSNVQIINQDILEYADFDTCDLYYLFSPFSRITLEKFLQHIINSFLNKKRDIYIVYNFPEFAYLCERYWFSEVCSISISYLTKIFKLSKDTAISMD